MSFNVSNANFQDPNAFKALKKLDKGDADKVGAKDGVLTRQELDVNNDGKLDDDKKEILQKAGVSTDTIDKIDTAVKEAKEAGFEATDGVISFGKKSGEVNILTKATKLESTTMLKSPTDTLKDGKLSFRLKVLDKEVTTAKDSRGSALKTADDRMKAITGKMSEIETLLGKKDISPETKKALETLKGKLKEDFQACKIMKDSLEQEVAKLGDLSTRLQSGDVAKVQEFLDGASQEWLKGTGAEPKESPYYLGDSGEKDNGVDSQFGQMTDKALCNYVNNAAQEAKIPDMSPLDAIGTAQKEIEAKAKEEADAKAKVEAEKVKESEKKDALETGKTIGTLESIYADISASDSDDRLRAFLNPEKKEDKIKNNEAAKKALAADPTLAKKMAEVLFDGVFSDDDKTAMSTLFHCADAKGKAELVNYALKVDRKDMLLCFNGDGVANSVPANKVSSVLKLLGDVDENLGSPESKFVRAMAGQALANEASKEKDTNKGVANAMAEHFVGSKDKEGLIRMGIHNMDEILNKNPKLTTGVLQTFGDIKDHQKEIIGTLFSQLKPDAQYYMLHHYNSTNDKEALSAIAKGLGDSGMEGLFKVKTDKGDEIGRTEIDKLRSKLEPGQAKNKIEDDFAAQVDAKREADKAKKLADEQAAAKGGASSRQTAEFTLTQPELTLDKKPKFSLGGDYKLKL